MSEQAPQIVFLKSNRVVMRPLLKEDVPLCLKWINDPEVREYLSVYQPMMEADENEWFESLHKQKDTNIVLTIVVDGKAIGVMGLHHISMKDGVATTGAYIGEKEYWNKGYGTEAKMLLLHYAFHTLNLRKVCSSVIAFNERSHAYSLKCGYKEEGRRKKQIYRNGEYHDEILLAVFREDWQPLWETFAEEHHLPKYC